LKTCHNPHQRHPQNGAQQKAYKNTDIALTIPSGYQGNAITIRTPRIPSQGTKTGSIGSRKTLIAIEQNVKEPRKYRIQPSRG
jgi:hypothetical protein